MHKFGVEAGDTVNSALSRLLGELKAWFDERKDHHLGLKWKGVHDEGTFATSWREYFLHSGDAKVRDFALGLFYRSEVWASTSLVHGYAPEGEVHHAVEHFVIFLAWLHELDPSNEELRQRLRLAANNIVEPPGPGLAWYDPSTNRFASTHLGTKKVGREGLNIPEHLRLARLALLGLDAGGPRALGRFVLDYAGEWADQVLSAKHVPLVLDEEEIGLEGFKNALETFIGAAPKDINDHTRSEVHIANGVPDLFIHLHRLTGKNNFLEAAARIVEPVVVDLASPYGHPVAGLTWELHQECRGRGFFPGTWQEVLEKVRTSLDRLDTSCLELEFDIGFWHESKWYNTVGIRADMPAIEILTTKGKGEGKRVEIPSPATLGLLYRTTGDEQYLILGLEMARAVFLEARNNFPDGRFHGCGSTGVHAACIGHGRNWGAGHVSTALRFALDPVDHGIPLPVVKL